MWDLMGSGVKISENLKQFVEKKFKVRDSSVSVREDIVRVWSNNVD